MLFHFSFYSNKQAGVPACRHADSVKIGRYHLSKVKFPARAADQPSLGTSELVLRSLRLGLNAARANFAPAVLIQLLMLSLVISYFYLPAVKPIFGVLTEWNVQGGLFFSFFAMGITVGGITEIFSVYLHKNGRWTGEDLANMSFNFVVFGLLGVMNSVFYQIQAYLFGTGRSVEVLAAKTLVDQFVYTPFLSNPTQTLAFLWRSEQFSFRRTVEKMRQFRQFYVLTVLPVLVSNWLFWIPMVVLIYCFPTSLQLPLGILACAIWSMLLTALVQPVGARATSGEEPDKLTVSDSAET
ncbi:MAG: hypothetical protein JOZ08_24700 [Verrucomicrobia bacterium]|nr:hypothetical protein [Verrucomicrobiota bacterium]